MATDLASVCTCYPSRVWGIAGRYHPIPSLHTPNVFDVKSSQECNLPSGFLSHPRAGLGRYVGPREALHALLRGFWWGGLTAPLLSTILLEPTNSRGALVILRNDPCSFPFLVCVWLLLFFFFHFFNFN